MCIRNSEPRKHVFSTSIQCFSAGKSGTMPGSQSSILGYPKSACQVREPDRAASKRDWFSLRIYMITMRVLWLERAIWEWNILSSDK